MGDPFSFKSKLAFRGSGFEGGSKCSSRQRRKNQRFYAKALLSSKRAFCHRKIKKFWQRKAKFAIFLMKTRIFDMSTA